MGTIVPRMGTLVTQDVLCSALFGETRRAVLALLFSRPDESFYLREVVRWAGTGRGAVQRELARLEQAGIVRRRRRGSQVHFQASAECPVFGELRGFVLKTVGLVGVLRAALSPLAERIRVAFIYGSVARGEARAASDVDLCVVGGVTFAEIAGAIRGAQEKLGREINPTVYPPAEFRGARAGEELRPYFAAADLFVLPGTGGLAVQEAMAHGLPVVVAKGDGTQDDLVRPENGWQIAPEDHEALVRTLQLALSNAGRLRKMGAESYRIVAEQINLEAMVRVFVQALNETSTATT